MKRLLVLLIACAVAVQHSGVTAMPMFLLTSGKPKCITTDAARHTLLRIYYEAPDLETSTIKGGEKGQTYITVTETPSKAIRNELLKARGGGRPRPPLPTSKSIEKSEGSLTHKVQLDSLIHICVRASAAGEKTPIRFALRAVEDGDESADAADESAYGKKKKESKTDTGKHMSHLETEILMVKRNVQMILHEADFLEERDGVLHKDTIKMHSATLYWPIIHVCILLITGFTQANHIVNFFKSRRIV
eukprot:CAMPEP_0198117210 /NCGR_PEP_ID=MMETSP1442-20131203/17168_1 /TAXON_ID= /ORGANISM="Craspedostauros australis, Strain CCMP3328" /LENGTH=246 /DNA_ID=CAMNT_0043775211 /DNA_START=40 /DNA_END=780 /DNA_ORIENTATION=+